MLVSAIICLLVGAVAGAFAWLGDALGRTALKAPEPTRIAAFIASRAGR